LIDAQQPQPVYAVEDAEQVRLVIDLSGEDRPPVFALYAHPLEGGGKPVTQFATRHYALDLACSLLADHLSSSGRPILGTVPYAALPGTP
jgi:hypothetical protein